MGFRRYRGGFIGLILVGLSFRAIPVGIRGNPPSRGGELSKLH